MASASGGAGDFEKDFLFRSGSARASIFAHFSARVTDRSHWATFGGKLPYQNAVRRQLRSHPVVVMQTVRHRNRREFAAQRLRSIYGRIRIRYPILSLMHAAVIVPADEFGEYMPKMSCIPDQNLHAGSMKLRNLEIQRNQLGRSFRGARAVSMLTERDFRSR